MDERFQGIRQKSWIFHDGMFSLARQNIER